MAGRIRTIKPEIRDDEVALDLTDTAWRLWVTSWTFADDHGRFRAGDRYLAAEVWRDTARRGRAAAARNELARAGLVRLYRVGGELYAEIKPKGWQEHQRIDRPGKPRVPTPYAEGVLFFHPNENGDLDQVSQNFSESFGKSRESSEHFPPRVRAGDQDQEVGSGTGSGTGSKDPTHFSEPLPRPVPPETPSAPTSGAGSIGLFKLSNPEPLPPPSPPDTSAPTKPTKAPRTPKPKPELPESLQRYAKAYADGISAATGHPFTPPADKRWAALFGRTLGAHAVAPDGTKLRGEELDAWIRASATAYRESIPDAELKFHPGFQPSAWAKWLDGGNYRAPLPRKPYVPPPHRLGQVKLKNPIIRRPEDILVTDETIERREREEREAREAFR